MQHPVFFQRLFSDNVYLQAWLAALKCLLYNTVDNGKRLFIDEKKTIHCRAVRNLLSGEGFYFQQH